MRNSGCFTSRGFVTNVNSVAGVVIKPLSELKANEHRINALSLGLNKKAKTVDKLARESKTAFETYIKTPVPVCGEGVVGWLGKAAGFDSYSECLAKKEQSWAPIDVGTVKFTQMGDKMRELHANYSELLSFSPSTLDWQKLCTSKLDLDDRHRNLKEENTRLVETSLKKLKGELAAQEKADNEFNRFEAMLKLFLEALDRLIKMVAAVFESFLRGLTKFSIFFSEHPTLFWVGGGVLALGIAAVALRPYISLASMAIGRRD
jgi:hypothetical protein